MGVDQPSPGMFILAILGVPGTLETVNSLLSNKVSRPQFNLTKPALETDFRGLLLLHVAVVSSYSFASLVAGRYRRLSDNIPRTQLGTTS